MAAVRFMASRARMLAILASACACAAWSGVDPAVLRSSRSGGPELADSWAFRSCRSRILASSSAARRAQLAARSRPGSVPSTYWLSHNPGHFTKAVGPLFTTVRFRIGHRRRISERAGG